MVNIVGIYSPWVHVVLSKITVLPDLLSYDITKLAFAILPEQ